MEYLGFLIIGLILCLVFYGYCINESLKKWAKMIEATGHVVDFKRENRKSYNTYVPIIEYSIENKTYQNEANFIQLSEEEMLKFDKDKDIRLSVDKDNYYHFNKTPFYHDGLLSGLFLGIVFGFSVAMTLVIIMNCGLFVAP